MFIQALVTLRHQTVAGETPALASTSGRTSAQTLPVDCSLLLTPLLTIMRKVLIKKIL